MPHLQRCHRFFVFQAGLCQHFLENGLIQMSGHCGTRLGSMHADASKSIITQPRWPRRRTRRITADRGRAHTHRWARTRWQNMTCNHSNPRATLLLASQFTNANSLNCSEHHYHHLIPGRLNLTSKFRGFDPAFTEKNFNTDNFRTLLILLLLWEYLASITVSGTVECA